MIEIEKSGYLPLLFGNCDENIKIIEDELNVRVFTREGELVVEGEET